MDETDRFLAALGRRCDDPKVLEARAVKAVEDSVGRYHQQLDGLEPWEAMDALKEAHEAWKRSRERPLKAA